MSIPVPVSRTATWKWTSTVAGRRPSVISVSMSVVIYYYYPGSTATPLSGSNSKDLSASSSGTCHNGELYIAGSWKFLTLKYNYAVTDYFSLPDSKGTSYLDLTANYDLGDGWGINGHVGHLYATKYKYAFTTGATTSATPTGSWA